MEHNLQEPWRCFYGGTFWPHVEVPLLYHQCLYDAHVREYTEPDKDHGQWEDMRARFTASYRSVLIVSREMLEFCIGDYRYHSMQNAC